MLFERKGPMERVMARGIHFHASMARRNFGLSTFRRGISFSFPRMYCQ